MITTVELKVNFTEPAEPSLLKASGQVISRGKHIAVGEAEVRSESHTLIAKGPVTYLVLGCPREEDRGILSPVK
jgi:acyl-coenzyme A thioesterase PaaI-like protein